MVPRPIIATHYNLTTPSKLGSYATAGNHKATHAIVSFDTSSKLSDVMLNHAKQYYECHSNASWLSHDCRYLRIIKPRKIISKNHFACLVAANELRLRFTFGVTQALSHVYSRPLWKGSRPRCDGCCSYVHGRCS